MRIVRLLWCMWPSGSKKKWLWILTERLKSKLRVEARVEPRVEPRSGALIFNKAPTEVLAEYSDYSNVFSAENVAELPEHIGMNDHAIKLEKSKQPPFDPIYSLRPVKLETLKTYIETNLANGFILPSKSSVGAPILFDKKPDRSFRLCVDY